MIVFLPRGSNITAELSKRRPSSVVEALLRGGECYSTLYLVLPLD